MKTTTPPRRTAHAGYTLLELLVALGIMLTMGAVALPNILGFRQEAALLGAAQGFKAQFMRARSVATMKNTQTAIRFETDENGTPMYSTYIDGNFNGVYSADIEAGMDTRIAGPFRLDAGQAGVVVGVLPDAPAPDGGKLGTEPIRFGNSRMVSFSPIGTGTPGTFYLRTKSTMAGVRVTGGSARVRIMVLRGKRWIDRQG
jgi:prepilin-type N-terminal cleavage/methylation domain-containing protein